jgi:hypothetical protein
MSAKNHDGLEARLAELFDAQARALPDSRREWSAVPVASVALLDEQRRRRRTRTTLGALATIAAVVALIVGVMNIGGSGKRVEVKPPVTGAPDVPAVHFETHQVKLDADDFFVEANGKRFTAKDTRVYVSTNPGASDQTLELEWQEHGLPMRLYIYFAADATHWRVTEMRTYDGKPDEEWIYYNGDRFRTPLGSAFQGNVDLFASAVEGDGKPSPHVGRLVFTNLRLEAFRRPAVCTNTTSKYVLDPTDDPVVDGSGGITARLLDAATCTEVPNLDGFVFDFSSADPAIAEIKYYPLPDPDGDTACDAECSAAHRIRAEVVPKARGETTGTVTAGDKASGAVVATTNFRVVSSGDGS